MLLVFLFFYMKHVMSIREPEKMKSYEHIHYYNLTLLNEFRQFLMEFDENGDEITNRNIHLGIYSPECEYVFQSPSFRAAERYASGNVYISASLPKDEFPFVTDDCAEIFFYRVGMKLDEAEARLTDMNESSILKFMYENRQITFTFTNDFTFPIELYWYQETIVPKSLGIIYSGESINFKTWLGHIFSAHEWNENLLITDNNNNHNHDNQDQHPGKVLDYMVVDGRDYFFHPQNRIMTCDFYEEDMILIPDYSNSNCENLEIRFNQFQSYIWYQKRIATNYVQPKLVPPLTSEGFILKKIPEEIYESIKSWYNITRYEEMIVERDSDICRNQKYSPSYITLMPKELQRQIHYILKPIFLDWYHINHSDITITSIYGIRSYRNNSILRMHVDSVASHALAAILNIDQSVEKDWPLFILDHDRNEHKITMQPGDMLLYESAKLLHGRPEPFVGNYYDNLFIFYRPYGWDYQWLVLPQ